MKSCRFCGVLLTDSNWYSSSKKAQNYSCISCHSVYYKLKYNVENNKIKTKEYNRQLKIDAFLNYGGIICVCCKEEELKFLTIDHVQNDGAIDRAKGLVGIKLYRWMRKNNYPDKARFRVLCYNCNSMRGNYGFCSHEYKNVCQNQCTICKQYLIERSIYNRNNKKNNYHLFFKHSDINICIDCSICLKHNTDDVSKKINSKISILNRRTNILLKYGGKCVCCGESKYCFLTIDHKTGQGNHKNANYNYGGRLYRKLKQENYPQNDYQLLCFNCNCAKGHFDECPHKIKFTNNMQ